MDAWMWRTGIAVLIAVAILALLAYVAVHRKDVGW